MTRAVLVLAGDRERARACLWARRLPVNTRVTFQAPKRSVPQNDRLWAHLADIARQADWHDAKLAEEDWKTLFLAALNTEMRIVPNLDGTGFVPLGRSSSKLSKSEFADLLSLIEAFAAQHGVELHDGK